MQFRQARRELYCPSRCTKVADSLLCVISQLIFFRVIKEFHEAKKPIGMLCVSPVIVAKLIPGVSVTLGNEDKGMTSLVRLTLVRLSSRSSFFFRSY